MEEARVVPREFTVYLIMNNSSDSNAKTRQEALVAEREGECERTCRHGN